MIPISFISLWVSESSLTAASPWLAQLSASSPVFTMLLGMIQPVCLVILQQILPPLFVAIGKLEGTLSFCQVHTRAFTRYFAWQVCNIFLVPSIVTSVFETAAMTIENPSKGFELLGYALPKTSSFFSYYVVLKASVGLGVELVRIVPIIQSLIRIYCLNLSTFREKRSLILNTLRPVDDPGFVPIHKVLGQDMLVFLIAINFAVIAPLVLIPCAFYFLFSKLLWTYQYLYTVEPSGESGLSTWPYAFRRCCFCLFLAQATLVGQFMLKNAWSQAYIGMVVMLISYLYLRRLRTTNDPSSMTLPLEIASAYDIVNSNREFDSNMTSGSGSGNEKLVQASTATFDTAYLQPALRANPKALPEAVFPPDSLNIKPSDFSSSDRDDGESRDDDFLLFQPSNISTGTVRTCCHYIDREIEIKEAWTVALEESGNDSLLKLVLGLEAGFLRSPVLEQREEGGQTEAESLAGASTNSRDSGLVSF